MPGNNNENNSIEDVNSQKSDNEEISLIEFERKHMELVYELNWKRQLVTKYEQDLHKATLHQREIERLLHTERKMLEQKTLEAESLKQSLELAEKNCYAAIEKEAESAVHLEITEKENTSLKAKNYTLSTENILKTRKIEELEMRVTCLLRYEKETNEQYSQICQTFTNLEKASEQLKIDHNRIKELVKDKDSFLSQLDIASLKHAKYLEAKARIDMLEKECCSLRVELENERSNNLNIPKMNSAQGFLAEMNLVSDLRESLENQRAISTALSEVIGNLTQELLDTQKLLNSSLEDKNTVATQTDFLLLENNNMENENSVVS